MDDMQREMAEQRDFYENALEERFNQMEHFENECQELRAQLQKAGDNNSGNVSHYRKWEQKEAELRAVEEAKVSQVQQKLEEMERQLREAMVLSEKRAEENYTLKQKIDQQRVDNEKAKKRAEVLEDQVVFREGELKMAREDIDKLHKKCKNMYP